MIELVFLDIDGTLIGSKGFVEDCVWRAVEKAQTAGIKMSVCTGRPGFGVAQRVAERLGSNLPHIFQNGAQVSFASGEPIKTHALKEAATGELIKHARQKGLTLELYTPTNLFVERKTPLSEAHASMIGVTPIVRDLSDVLTNEPVVRAQWVIPADKRDVALECQPKGTSIGIAGSPMQKEALFISVTQSGVSKGSAVALVADTLKVDLANCMAVGDSEGDTPMLERVGHPVVMGNAEYALQEAFGSVAGHVDNCGVVAALDLAIASAE